MKLSKNLKWIIISSITIIFLVISVYRYQIVNKPYKNYTVIEETIKQNELTEINGFEMTFGKPQLIEHDEKYTLEVPLTVINKRSEIARLGYEDFMIIFNQYSQNGLGYEEVSNHPDNQSKSFAFEAIPPDEEGHAQLVFNLMKDWGVNETMDASLYYVTFSDNIVTKYKLPYETP